MASLVDFLHDLFRTGRIAHEGPPVASVDDRGPAARLLAAAYDDHRLDVAGPPIPFDPTTALTAAELLRRASWFLVNPSEPPEALERTLLMPGVPLNASEHLSADLPLRFLPQVHRRARSTALGDQLARLLADVLRRWPLSGVLSDIDAGPTPLGDLGNHPGLRLLYAERLAAHEKPAWLPDPGPTLDHVELVYQGLGRSCPRKIPPADPEIGPDQGRFMKI